MPPAPIVRVMVNPVTAYRDLAGSAEEPRGLAFLSRPAFLSLLIGSTLAVSTIGRLSLRLILSGSLLWSFVPALEIGALASVMALFSARRLPLRTGIHLFFLGIGPWCLWLLSIAALFSFAPPSTGAAWLSGSRSSPLRTEVVPVVLSAFVTFGFFRGALEMSKGRALAAALSYHLLLLAPPLLYFLATDQLMPRLFGIHAS